MESPTRKPEWLNETIRRLAVGERASGVLSAIADHDLHTVCTSARCPNKGTCFSEGTATFMILGNVCTRSCRFCDIGTGRPAPPDPEEPERVAEASAALGLRFVVVTSVTRDDLPDEGASHFADTVRAIKARIAEARVEVLVPDFNGRVECLERVIEAGPDVLNHNLETVRRLTPKIRSKARYDRSLEVLARFRELAPGIPTKSGIMVGLGEERDELLETFADLAAVGIERLTIGQYLRPSREHLAVARYYEPHEFEVLRTQAKNAGIRGVLAGPLVRSSYHAGRFA